MFAFGAPALLLPLLLALLFVPSTVAVIIHQWDFRDALNPAIVDLVGGRVAQIMNGADSARTATGVVLDGVDDYIALDLGAEVLGSLMSIEMVVTFEYAFTEGDRLFDCGNGPSADNIILYIQNTDDYSHLSAEIYEGSTERMGMTTDRLLRIGVRYHIIWVVRPCALLRICGCSSQRFVRTRPSPPSGLWTPHLPLSARALVQTLITPSLPPPLPAVRIRKLLAVHQQRAQGWLRVGQQRRGDDPLSVLRWEEQLVAERLPARRDLHVDDPLGRDDAGGSDCGVQLRALYIPRASLGLQGRSGQLRR